MPGTRVVKVNKSPVSVPVGASSRQIKALAVAAGVQPAQWGSGAMELREYRGSGARLLDDGDVPRGNDFGLREVNPKREPGFKTLEGWDKAVVGTYPEYIQKALRGEGARYFSGSWDDTTIGPPGFMTPHQISAAAYVPLVKVYTLSGNQYYHIPGGTWVNEHGEPNPYQSNGRFLLPMAEAILCVEAFRKYRAYRRDRFGGGLPPEMQGLSDEELRPIREYIALMKAEERAGWAPSAHGPDYVNPKPFAELVTRETVGRAWNAQAGRVETLDEAWERVQADIAKDRSPAPPVDDDVDDDDELAIYADIDTAFTRGWNRFYRATGDLPVGLEKLTVKWNGFLRVRVAAVDVDQAGQFGKRLRVGVNGFDLTLDRHRSGKYYQVKLGAEEMRRVVGYTG